VTPEQIPERTSNATFEDLYRAYAAELPRWFYRLGLSEEQARDSTQTLWLIVTENIRKIPASEPDTKNALSKLAATIAKKTRRHAARDDDRYQVANPDDLPGRIPNAEQMACASELIDAIDSLPENLRGMFIANKIEGRGCPEIAAMTGVKEDAIEKRVWNACAQIRYKLGYSDERKGRHGVVIAPAEIEIPLETRAAFCAIWSAEGRMPEFGGPKDPPPPPIPWFAKASPAVSETARAVSLKINQTILLILLFLTSAGTVALIWLWEPAKLDNARAGLRVPQTPVGGESNDVVDAYPAQAPAAPSAHAPTPKIAPKTSQALDDDALQELDGPGLTRSGSGSE
jgi:DNA-directed RNA polymerase specialized sigma24 family protein